MNIFLFYEYTINMEKLKRYLPSLVFILVVALIGLLFTNSGMNWFDKLNKPTEWIPVIVIPIMWTIIYSLFYIYTIARDYYNNSKLTTLLIINGLLNILWCLMYFVINTLLGGLIVIVLNLIASILVIVEISKEDKLFGYILMIYPLWLSVATSLNIATWILN